MLFVPLHTLAEKSVQPAEVSAAGTSGVDSFPRNSASVQFMISDLVSVDTISVMKS